MKITKYLDNILFAIKIIMKASRKMFIAKISLSVILTMTTYMEYIIMKNIINFISSGYEIKMWIVYVVAFVICAFLIDFGNVISKQVDFYYKNHINMYLDNILVDKVSRLKYSLFDESDVLNKIEDAWELITTIEELPALVFSFAICVGKILVSIIIFAQINVVLCVIIIFSILASVCFYKKSIDERWNTERKSISFVRKMNYYKECLGQDYFFNLKIFDYADFFLNKYLVIWKKWYKEREKLSKKIVNILLCSIFFLALSECILMLTLIYKFLMKKVLLGDVIYYYSIIQELKNACDGLVFGGSSLIYALNELMYVRELLEFDCSDNLSETRLLEPYEITFENVWFKYPEKNNYILKDCNFTIKNNEVVGLVGKNGSGKSTIIKLLLSLYEPSEGRILLNGVDYKEYDISEIRKKIGIMFQDFCRYSLSFKENIIISELELAENIDMIENAIDNSGCKSILKKINNDLDAQLTKRFYENGVEFSTGQWQKIALARSFFGKKTFYLLDEPSSALDPVSEDKILIAFEKMIKGKSGIIVTHRISSLNFVDKILVLENGKIIESGTPHQLLELNGLYADFYYRQANKYV